LSSGRIRLRLNSTVLIDKSAENPYIHSMKKKPIPPNSELRDNLGKLLLDMAKLTFASFILGGILKGELPQNILIAAGSIVFLIFAAAGLILTSRKKNRG
jgi:hypothetical protein